MGNSFFGGREMRAAITRTNVLSVIMSMIILFASFASTSAFANHDALSNTPFNVDSIMTEDELAAEFGPAPAQVEDGWLNRIGDFLRPSSRLNLTATDFRLSLNEELLSYYEAVLYVNKAAKGATAQTMRVYSRVAGARNEWRETQRLKVSTGREKQEQYFTGTPVGVFNLDGERMYKMAYSGRWGGSPMPYAMFFDVQFSSRKTGIAIHGAPKTAENKLGTRASGGCVRVGNREVEALYNWITTSLAGEVPQFSWDRSLGKTSPNGVMDRDSQGTPVLKKGYKVLVVVVDAQD